MAVPAEAPDVVSDRAVDAGHCGPDGIPHPGVPDALVQQEQYRAVPDGVLGPDLVGPCGTMVCMPETLAASRPTGHGKFGRPS
jgi:hypothetical protein